MAGRPMPFISGSSSGGRTSFLDMFKPKPPAAIARPAPAPARYTQPLRPVANYQPYVAPQPAYRAPQPTYRAPAPSYGGGGGGGGGGGAAASYSPPPPPPPPKRLEYADFTDEMAATDSAFTEQQSAYANALKKFIEDNESQGKVLDSDANVAQQGIARNRAQGLAALGEDFASRGLTNSGLFAEEKTKAEAQYGRQKDQVTTGLTNAKNDLAFRRSKYEQENGANGTNIQAARREAYARLAASQGLT